MSREDIAKEIMRVEEALEKTDSRYLKKDYGKYLKRLYRELGKRDRERR